MILIFVLIGGAIFLWIAADAHSVIHDGVLDLSGNYLNRLDAEAKQRGERVGGNHEA